MAVCVLILQDLNDLMTYYVNNKITISISKYQYINFTLKTKPVSFTYETTILG